MSLGLTPFCGSKAGQRRSAFLLILREIAKRRLAGTAITAVRRTGDLETKDAARIFEIYDSLSTSGSLVPPAIGFILDRECRTARELEDIRKRSAGKAVFLPRRMYENYILNPAAIASLNVDGLNKQVMTPDNVRAAIDKKRREQKYFCSSDPSDRTDDNWLKHVDGAKLLRDLLNDFSGKTVEYDKVAHGIEITRWLIQHSPEDLGEVADLLDAVVPKA